MNIKAFIKLIRFDNLLVIALTMLATRYGLMQPILSLQYPSACLQLSTVDFSLLIISTMLIAAAGYIINDYFDIKTDRINKPEKLYIDNGVKRRVAIITHIILNVIGLLLSVYVSMKSNAPPLLFAIAAIVLLWFYSTHFKRQVLIGNLVVALLTAMIPLQVFFFDMSNFIVRTAPPFINYSFVLIAVICFSVFAFLLSMVREIIKDIEDLKGDFETGCKTMPVVWGIKAAKAIAAGLISNTVLLLFFIFYKLYKQHFSMLLIYLFVFVFVPLIILIWKLYKSHQKNEYHQLSKWVKYIMLSGVLATSLIYLTCNGFI